MEAPKKIADNPGVQASVLAGGITFVATTAPLLFPKIRKGLGHALPRVKNIIKRADDPTELKESVESELKEEMADQFRNHLTEGIQSKANEAAEKLRKKKDENAEKVHANAEKVEDRMQNTLMQVRDKVAGVKESGQDFQRNMKKRTNSESGIRGVNQIKGVRHIKSATSIKSSTNIKGPGSIKHHSDLKRA
ncbi:gas vesicle protein GvpQ [Oceanobacillus damuensis]|uniref:gas vesicle protein GvpQ n=1 Tax=Oceanobacillus damuensis TaxID=937928 RepID=UPI00082D0315|nr:gas vesicle protein GvpQ [Oceanobacillus damuensis]